MKAQKVFLVDAVGAIISMLCLSLLYYFEGFFGMPQSLLRIFIFTALAFAIYSFAVYLANPANWPPYLTIIAMLNLGYCFYTIYGVWQHWGTITFYGQLYFAGEVLVILALASFELWWASKKVGYSR
jgi:hypothetical protein